MMDVSQKTNLNLKTPLVKNICPFSLKYSKIYVGRRDTAQSITAVFPPLMQMDHHSSTFQDTWNIYFVFVCCVCCQSERGSENGGHRKRLKEKEWKRYKLSVLNWILYTDTSMYGCYWLQHRQKSIPAIVFENTHSFALLDEPCWDLRTAKHKCTI